LVSIISGAVGTALVGKILDSGWFAFSLFSSGVVPKHAAFSNLMLVFAVVVVWGGVLYLRSYQATNTNPEPQLRKFLTIILNSRAEYFPSGYQWWLDNATRIQKEDDWVKQTRADAGRSLSLGMIIGENHERRNPEK
jgi:hypothetical protein